VLEGICRMEVIHIDGDYLYSTL